MRLPDLLSSAIYIRRNVTPRRIARTPKNYNLRWRADGIIGAPRRGKNEGARRCCTARLGARGSHFNIARAIGRASTRERIKSSKKWSSGCFGKKQRRREVADPDSRMLERNGETLRHSRLNVYPWSVDFPRYSRCACRVRDWCVLSRYSFIRLNSSHRSSSFSYECSITDRENCNTVG